MVIGGPMSGLVERVVNCAPSACFVNDDRRGRVLNCDTGLVSDPAFTFAVGFSGLAVHNLGRSYSSEK